MKKKIKPSPFLSILPLVLLVTMLVCVIRSFGSDALGGASQVVLLLASGCCVAIGMLRLYVPWRDFERAIIHNVGSVTTAIIILLLIGALGGTWMLSGVVPSLIYYGLQIIRPEVFLVASCVISALVSVMTGSSWTTIATIGIALMGIGQAFGFHEGWIAGAIISGAYFGDKISPLSDTTVLASSAAEVTLFTHIRYMLITTLPSFVVALVVFSIAGWGTAGVTDHQVDAFAHALNVRFCITPWLLLVPIITGLLIARRVPSIITLFLSVLMALGAALIFQRPVLEEIAEGDVFRGAMLSVYGSTALSTADATLSNLVATRGMAGMMGTIWLILCAMCFGGTMQAGGMVRGITRMLVGAVRGRISLVGATVCSGLMLNLAIADQYLCILLNANLLKRIYDVKGYERRLLSRTTEDSVTVTSVLVPWNTCGMTQSTVLGVSTFTYLPYCIFNLLSPVMSIIIAAIGYRIYPRRNKVVHPVS